MKTLTRTCLSFVALLALGCGSSGSAQRGAAPASLFAIPVPLMDGGSETLAPYEGRVLLIVNVASKCGNTPQYAGLETLYERYADRGLTVLAFPANNFGNQEPGSNQEIREFCTANYGVEFPLFAKISVKGEDMHPLYRYLTAERSDPGFSGEIGWNFTKFLVDRRGRVIARFEPKMQPLSDAVVMAIERALAS